MNMVEEGCTFTGRMKTVSCAGFMMRCTEIPIPGDTARLCFYAAKSVFFCGFIFYGCFGVLIRSMILQEGNFYCRLFICYQRIDQEGMLPAHTGAGFIHFISAASGNSGCF